MTLTFDQWNKMLDAGKIKDISSELPDGFLMVYQVMRAKIVLDGKTYFASAWTPPGDKPFVDLMEAA